ncbi:RNA-binding S4 domain-containing protein [Clostridiaceae bacterium M8S5]|nr:RNA-binding S4 domain-containing protein [Clostridiaceae bacterium M8S5]
MKENIKIETEFIKLDQLLKYASIVQTGGHAKELISEGLVSVNGEVVLTRGKKIHRGDIVNINMDKNIELVIE